MRGGARAWRHAGFAASLAVLAAGAAGAQTINGVADWTVSRADFTSGDQQTRNRSLAQTYTLGYRSVLWDPRFLTYDGELTFQRTGLKSNAQRGRLHNLGYSLTASLFPARPFPLTIQASRAWGGQSGDFPLMAPIRGGLTLPPGTIAPDLHTLTRRLGVNWLLAPKDRPRFEFSYRRGALTATAGPLQGEQRDSNLTTALTKESAASRQVLRFQRTAYDNLLTDAFKERLNDLGYELTRRMSAGTRATARAGYRRTYSLFDIAPQFTDVGRGAYLPSARGGFGLYYAIGSLTHRASDRLTAELTTSYDRGSSIAATTQSVLLASTSRYRPWRPLTLSGTANTGIRRQQVEGSDVTVRTRNVIAGLDFAVPLQLVQGSAGAERGVGWNTAYDGAEGRSRLWTARAGLSSRALRWVDLSAGHERGRNEDDILTNGNFSVIRSQAAARSSPGGRAQLEVSWEDTESARGLGAELVRGRFVVISGSGSLALGQHRRAGATIGAYRNATGFGTDRNGFEGVTYADAYGRLRLWFSARRERSRLQAAPLRQDAYYTVAQAEYRLRLFAFSVEHRYTNIDYRDLRRLTPFGFAGNQLLFRVSRRFSVELGSA